MTQRSKENEGITRRVMIAAGAAAGAFLGSAHGLRAENRMPAQIRSPAEPERQVVEVTLRVNGTRETLALDSRTTILDALREHLGTGTKKGCDHGQCGACTVMLNGRRINSCLTLAVMHEGDEIVTIEGLGGPDDLHPMQAAFLRHDGFQCGYCTPGQICSATAMLREHVEGWPSHVTADVTAPPVALTDAEIRERMSGNICRCAAYPNIVAAIRDAAPSTIGGGSR
jgi:xanthine dehydrogenase YagT iron-sulfur-binding subunit